MAEKYRNRRKPYAKLLTNWIIICHPQRRSIIAQATCECVAVTHHFAVTKPVRARCVVQAQALVRALDVRALVSCRREAEGLYLMSKSLSCRSS
jgi:hypothetical protein